MSAFFSIKSLKTDLKEMRTICFFDAHCTTPLVWYVLDIKKRKESCGEEVHDELCMCKWRGQR